MKTVSCWFAVVCILLQVTVRMEGAEPGQPILLENPQMALELDAATGAIRSVQNKLAGETYQLGDLAFDIEVGEGAKPGTLGRLTPAVCKPDGVSVDPGKVTYWFVQGKLRVVLTYTLAPGDAFAVKTLELRHAGSDDYNLNRVALFDWALSSKPDKAMPYYGFAGPENAKLARLDDGEPSPPSDTSTAFFFRYKEGGFFTTVTCDYVLMQDDAQAGRYRSVYWPGYILPAGMVFRSERGIIGVYPRKGLFHRPWQEQAGLRDFLFPAVDTRLDRGEIEAVTSAVQAFIKPGVYRVLINAWGIGLPLKIDSAEAEEAYRRAVDTLVKIPQVDALHFVHGLCGLAEEFHDQGLGLKLQPNAHAEAVFSYARSKRLGLSPFIGLSNNFPLNKEGKEPLGKDRHLLSQDARGQRRRNNIAMSRRYTDFLYQSISQLKARYPIVGQSYDFLNIMPDFDTGHGYLPGRASLYPQYANVREINRRLRADFPDLMLRGQIGWRTFGPWFAETTSMCHNAEDHQAHRQRNFLDCHIDHHFANNIRLSNWYANNCKMCPRHKMNANSIHNGSGFRAWDYGAWEFAVLSQIACAQVFGALHNLPDELRGEVLREEDKRFFDRWITWQKAHLDYYLRETELFGEPRPDGVDGYAYGNGRDSVLFLCNPTYQTRAVTVPISGDIHLPSGPRYTVKELYPEERYRMGLDQGVFAHGSGFTLEVPPQTVMVFEVIPDDATQPLLLGVAGTIEANADAVRLSGLSGPAGTTRAYGVRLPTGVAAPAKVLVGGQPADTTAAHGLLLGAVQFKGDRVDPEIRDWQAVATGDRMKITARFEVPAAARDRLRSQDLPVSSAYSASNWLAQTAWLGWGRGILFVPVLPEGVEADDLRGDVWPDMVARFGLRATLNGQPMTPQSNLMGDQPSRQRWSGFFLDASELLRFGGTNLLELDLPKVDESRFFGLYLPNLTRHLTKRCLPAPPPTALPTLEMPAAQEAFLSPPALAEREGKTTIHLKLRLTASQPSVLHLAKVKVEFGAIRKIQVTEVDRRWLGGEGLRLGARPKEIRFELETTAETRLILGQGDDRCELSVGQRLASWRERGAIYEPDLGSQDWTSRNARVVMELTGPMVRKTAVQDAL